MHCCQFWAVISIKVRSMGGVIISQNLAGKWGVFGLGVVEDSLWGVFGLEVVEDSLFCCGCIGSHFWLGVLFDAADAGGNAYIPPCNPPENPF